MFVNPDENFADGAEICLSWRWTCMWEVLLQPNIVDYQVLVVAANHQLCIA